MDAPLSSAAPGVSPETSDRLGKLLEHPAIWRGRSVARVETISTGFEALDRALPGQGWPRAGLIEILVARIGVGELYLLLPALAALTHRASARWCAWISPPFEPFAPALAAHGVALDRVFVARGESGWAFEQALSSGACEAVLGWAGKSPVGTSRSSGRPARARKTLVRKALARKEMAAPALRARDIRRLQLAAEKGRALGVLFRPRQAANESSSAVLRMVVEPAEQGARVTLLKSRGGHRGSIDLTWNSQHCSPRAHGST